MHYWYHPRGYHQIPWQIQDLGYHWCSNLYPRDWYCPSLEILMTGLMIHFRGPEFNQGHLIMCQIFVAIGGGTMSFLTQLAVMAVVSHQDTAAVLGILVTVTSIDG